MHVNFTRVKRIDAIQDIKSELKREVKRGSTFTFTCDLSHFASILFANINFAHYARQNYAAVEIHL